MSSMFFNMGEPRWHMPLSHSQENESEIQQDHRPYQLRLSAFPITCTMLAILFIWFNIKLLPGMWHMRILNAFRFILRTQRPPVAPCSSHIFQPLITSSSAQLLELDFNIHKSNSSYFADLDISRTHLVCTLFARGIEKMRGGTAAYTGSKNPQFGLALGAVSCSFRKAVLPYQQYDMWSRILSWDDKWVYIVTHFVRKGAGMPASFTLYPAPDKVDETVSRGGDGREDGSPKGSVDANGSLFATALSKCVFKAGRKTVSPLTMLTLSDLLPSSEATDKGDLPDDIRTQRIEGLRLCSALAARNQKALEDEFGGTNGVAVLAQHGDGAGIFGVVSTLLQLAGLKQSQAL